MILHLFKLIWNKKKENFLLISEMFVSFIVIFAVFSLLVYYLFNYRKPMGFDHENIWVVRYSPPQSIGTGDSLYRFYDNVKKMIKTFPQVRDASYTGNNFPFSFNSSNNDINYNNERALANIFIGEDNYASILNVKMKQGRWFTTQDNASRLPPLVINEKLKEKLFGADDAIGKEVKIGQDKFNVVGVADNMKSEGSYQEIEYSMFKRMDTNELKWNSTIFVKVQPGADAEFEGKLYKMLSEAIGTSIEIEHLEKKLESKNKLMQVPLIISIVVAGFLIINVALGLFGVLWYNINKRRGEIGLRRAIGAPAGAIFQQLIGEAVVLSTISLLIGIFFAIQFPLLNIFDLHPGIYLTAIGLSALFIYVLVTVCALYPGEQAAAIYPAVALHEE